MNELEHPLTGYGDASYDKVGHVFQKAQQPHAGHTIQLSLEASKIVGATSCNALSLSKYINRVLALSMLENSIKSAIHSL